MYEIRIIGKVNKSLMEYIQHEHKEKVLGIYEIYEGLCVSGKCATYNKTRAYYVAFTLASHKIGFEITEI